MSFDNQIFGDDAIAEYFTGYLDRMAGLKLASTDKYVETGHFTGLLRFTPKS